MPKVSTKSLRRLANKLPDSAGMVSGALSESADYIDELEAKVELYKKTINETLESMNGYDHFKYSEKLEQVLKD